MGKLTCPIRGALRVHPKAKDEITFTEEYQRIECVKYLLKKKYPPENFDFEENILRYGSGGKSSLRADVVVYHQSKKDLGEEEKVRNIEIVAEIKRKKESRSQAIQHQLFPALNHAPNCKYGIYWDDENRIFYRKEDQEKHYDIMRLPSFGEGWDVRLLRLSDLQEIEDSPKLLAILNQRLHNIAGASMSYRYGELFKLLLVKYYDEIKHGNGENTNLEFQVYENETEKGLKQRIDKLYIKAKGYYTANSMLKIDEDISLRSDVLLNFVTILQKYSFIKTRQAVIQEFFTKFAPKFLKAELDQYYTPHEVVEFVADVMKIRSTSLIIDPCGGSADFLTSFIKKGEFLGIDSVKQNVHYWDIAEEASNVAILNMVLIGDSRTNVKVMDSIEHFSEGNAKFDIVVTNPPFGKETVWEGDLDVMKNYELGQRGGEPFRQQLGILFIERDLKLLKPDGIMAIILPNGYLTKESFLQLREYILSHARIIANIELPENVFRKSGAGGYTSILILSKEKTTVDYEIFLARVKKIGFDHTRKKTPKLWQRDPQTGDMERDEQNRPIPDNELIEVAKKFKAFAHKNRLGEFEWDEGDIAYEWTTRQAVEKSRNQIISVARNTREYLNEIARIKKGQYTTLKRLGAEVSKRGDFIRRDVLEYEYIEIGNTFNGVYKSEKHRGWELPGRAKIKPKKNDIFVAVLSGSIGKFFIFLEEGNFVITDGFYRVRIEDERERLNFYYFLNSESFKIQMDALRTGTIMAEIEQDDFENLLLIPQDAVEHSAQKVRKFIEAREAIRSN